MDKSETPQNPAFLEYVYQLNEGTELMEALQLSLKAINELDIAQLNTIGLKTYAKGKWTIPTLLQHLIDWETICVFFEYEMPLYAIGLTITAHQIHHLKVIQERYFPLAQ